MTLLDYAVFWSSGRVPDELIPKDLLWDRATVGVTRNISQYTRSYLLSMFTGMAGKITNYGAFDTFTPIAHRKNALQKIIRMTYQMSLECRKVQGYLPAGLHATIKALDKVMAQQGVTVKGSGSFN